MLLHNKLFQEELPDTAVRVPFNTLTPGDRYQHRTSGWVNQVYKRDVDSITVKRQDGWLVTCAKHGFIWDKMVIKVAPLRK